MATKLDAAKVQLVMHYPFFGSLVLRRAIEITEKIPTAAVNKAGDLMFNPKFMDSLSIPELVFVLAHETMHVVYGHLARLGNRNPEVWNIATDAVINEFLIACDVGKFIKGGVRMEGAETRTADAVYNELMAKLPPPPPPPPTQPDGDKDGDGGEGGAGKDGQPAPDIPGVSGKVSVKDILPEEAKGTTEAEAKEAEAKGKMEIAEAAQAARMQGKMDGTLAGIIDKILESKMPWHSILERYMVKKSERRQTWNRPNKRFLNSGFYLPRRQRMPSMGKVVVGIDTSGSITDREMSAFLGHMNRIMADCNPEELIVLYVTNRVEHVEKVERGEGIPKPKRRWCGGTDMCEVVRWIEKNEDDVDVCVIFTDGYTDYPKDAPCDLLWVLTEKVDHAGAYGEFIEME
jgi:predicted metal-dependent peptidase